MSVVTKQTLQRRSMIMCVGVGILVFATGGIMLGVHFTISNDDGLIRTPTNVLFIVVDDLRPVLGCFGDKKAITPNIDQLSRHSIKFNKAFVQQALCAPSRNSFLTSRRPDTLQLYDTHSYWRTAVGNFTTIPQHFKQNNFHTVSIGKIFHPGQSSGYSDDYPYSWSEEPYHPSTLKYRNAKECPTASGKKRNLYCPVNVKEQPEQTLPDIQIASEAMRFLRRYSNDSNNEKPFFLAVGFHKPHIPFKFPEEYAALYPSMELAPNRKKPEKMPIVAWNPWVDVRSRDDVQELNVSFPYGPLPDDYQKLARIGYYASTSYLDDLIGKLLATLEETEFSHNTMVVLVGDHGWSLGEHQEWAKYSNFENAVNVPLMMMIPGVTDKERKHFNHTSVLEFIQENNQQNRSINKEEIYRDAGISNSAVKWNTILETDELVELVDLFPTISDIMHLEVPNLCPKDSKSSVFCTEGVSLKPLITTTVEQLKYIIEDFSWKKAVFSQYPRPSLFPQNNSDQPSLGDITIMGYSIRTKEFRYTEWIQFFPETFQRNWSVVYARELYYHTNDSQEDNNLADETGCQETVKKLSNDLQKGWRAFLPPVDQ